MQRWSRGGVCVHVRLIHGRGYSPDHHALAVASIGSNPVTFIDAAINATAGNSSPLTEVEIDEVVIRPTAQDF